jgi:hypothetical protein
VTTLTPHLSTLLVIVHVFFLQHTLYYYFTLSTLKVYILVHYSNIYFRCLFLLYNINREQIIFVNERTLSSKPPIT